MEFLGVGAAEALVVFVLILILVGPQRFPEMMRQGGRWYRIARGFTTEVMKDVRAAVDEIEQEVQDDPDLQSIRDLSSVGGELERDLSETRRDIDRAGAETAAAAQVETEPSKAPRPISSARSASGGAGGSAGAGTGAAPRQPSRLLNQLRERGSDAEAASQAAAGADGTSSPPRPATPRSSRSSGSRSTSAGTTSSGATSSGGARRTPRPISKRTEPVQPGPQITLPDDDPFKALEARRAAASGESTPPANDDAEKAGG